MSVIIFPTDDRVR